MIVLLKNVQSFEENTWSRFAEFLTMPFSGIFNKVMKGRRKEETNTPHKLLGIRATHPPNRRQTPYQPEPVQSQTSIALAHRTEIADAQMAKPRVYRPKTTSGTDDQETSKKAYHSQSFPTTPFYPHVQE